jgi:aspartyl aminopeptidase
MYEKTTAEMASFIQKSPTAFHAVANIRKVLAENGFCELTEGKPWKLSKGEKYFVTRNNSSIVAFALGGTLDHYSFKVAASHSDSPSFKVKENDRIEVKGKYAKLNTEGYGGMLCATWFDRPLSIAGRVVVKDGECFHTRLIDFDRDLVLIPSLAIHMNRNANEGYAYNKQVDMLPLLGCVGEEPVHLKKMVAQELGIGEEMIYGTDLYLYNRMAPSIWGADREFISSGRLDDLQCAWTSLQGFLRGEDDGAVNVFACFDNEEVGSGTKQGAGSTFLYDVLSRVNNALGKSREDYYCALASSFMLSCDNAHAVHPNQPDKTDVNNCVYINDGIVVKSHAGQKYTSDAVSIAVFRGICEKAAVPLQFFANRSDMAGGSTLGNIAMAQVSMNSIDIGLPQLAMHSAYETAGVKDSYYMEQALQAFFSSTIEERDADTLCCF